MKTYKLLLITILFISSAVTVSADGPKKSFPDKVKEVFVELSEDGYRQFMHNKLRNFDTFMKNLLDPKKVEEVVEEEEESEDDEESEDEEGEAMEETEDDPAAEELWFSPCLLGVHGLPRSAKILEIV